MKGACYTLLFFFWGAFAICNIRGQITLPSTGHGTIMGESSVANPNSFSAFNAIGALDFTEKNGVAISAKNYYLIEGLNSFTGTGHFKTDFATIGGSILRYGDAAYSESSGGLAVGKLITENFSVGVKGTYVSLQAEFTETVSTLYPEIGLFYRLSPYLYAAAQVRNPFGQKLDAPHEENLSSLITAGLHYNPNKRIELNLQIDNDSAAGFSAGSGIQYNLISRFNVLAGFRTDPTLISAGFGLNLQGFDATLGGSYNPDLGYSPNANFEYAF